MSDGTTVVEMEPVKVVFEKGQSALVEWADVRRSLVPAIEIKAGHVRLDTLLECPTYGIDWEEYLSVDLDSNELALKLRKAGIWTLEDLQTKDRVVARIAVNIIGKAVWDAAKRATAKGVRKDG